jgi:SAM-dependent methyltransferase
MKKKIILKPYEALAVIYEHLMKNVRYDFWAEYINFIVREYLPRKPKVLELAAGNLKFAKRIKTHFKDITVSDISYNMLHSSSPARIPRVCCDMTALPFKKKFDLVISSFDSVNYLTTKNKLLTLFREVEKILNDDGIFTFDVVLEKNCISYEQFANRKGTYKGINFEQISNYDKKKKFHKNVFNIFLPTGESVTEIHKQKIYSFYTYFEVISKTNLYVVDCLKTFTFEKADSESDRAQFILKRSRQHGIV